MLWTLVMTLAPPANAATVEVKPTDDVVSLTASLSAGDVVTFDDGTYELAGSLDWTGTGTAASPIKLVAKAGAHPKLELTDGSYVARIHDAAFLEVHGLAFSGSQARLDDGGWFEGVSIADSSDITLEDVVIHDTHATALALDGNNKNLTIHRVEIYGVVDDNGIGLGCWDASCWTQDSTISECFIHDLPGQHDGIVMDAGTQNVTVTDNVIETIGYRGIQAMGTEFGKPNVIEGNAIWGTQEDGLYLAGAAIVRNNLIFDIDGHGIRSTDDDGNLADQVIAFNTVYGTTDWGVYLSGWAGKDGMVFASNAVTNTTGRAFHADDGELDDGNHISNNVLSGYVDGIGGAGSDTGVTDAQKDDFAPGQGDGDYEDVATYDYYPSATSVLINAADATSEGWVPTRDFNGANRDGEAPDVGAYEVVVDSNPGWKPTAGFKTLVDPDTIAQGNVGGCCAKNKDSSAAILFPLPFVGLFLRRRRR